MPAAKLHLRMDRGSSYYRELLITGGIIPVGTTFRLHILADAHDDDPLAEFNSIQIESDLGTLITIELAPESTRGGQLPEDVYPYRIEAVIPGALDVVRMLTGNLVIRP